MPAVTRSKAPPQLVGPAAKPAKADRPRRRAALSEPKRRHMAQLAADSQQRRSLQRARAAAWKDDIVDTLAELSGSKSYKSITLKKNAFMPKKAKRVKRSIDYAQAHFNVQAPSARAQERTFADMAHADMGESEHESCDGIA